jgi:hypothetical protein
VLVLNASQYSRLDNKLLFNVQRKYRHLSAHDKQQYRGNEGNFGARSAHASALMTAMEEGESSTAVAAGVAVRHIEQCKAAAMPYAFHSWDLLNAAAADQQDRVAARLAPYFAADTAAVVLLVDRESMAGPGFMNAGAAETAAHEAVLEQGTDNDRGGGSVSRSAVQQLLCRKELAGLPLLVLVDGGGQALATEHEDEAEGGDGGVMGSRATAQASVPPHIAAARLESEVRRRLSLTAPERVPLSPPQKYAALLCWRRWAGSGLGGKRWEVAAAALSTRALGLIFEFAAEMQWREVYDNPTRVVECSIDRGSGIAQGLAWLGAETCK